MTLIWDTNHIRPTVMELGLAEAWATGDASLLGPAGALLVALVTVAVLDMGLRLMLTCTGSWDRGQRWYFLHSMANWLVVATGFQDVVVSFDAPANSMNPAQPWSQVPGGASFASPLCGPSFTFSTAPLPAAAFYLHRAAFI